MNSVSFVLGNGTSRKDISLDSLKDIGTTYGCNALYRTFSPRYLICVDSKMVHEINNAGYQQKHSVWTNYKEEYKNYTIPIDWINITVYKPGLIK